MKCHKLEQIRKLLLPLRILENRTSDGMTSLFGNDELSYITGKYIFSALKYRAILIENTSV